MSPFIIILQFCNACLIYSLPTWTPTTNTTHAEVRDWPRSDPAHILSTNLQSLWNAYCGHSFRCCGKLSLRKRRHPSIINTLELCKVCMRDLPGAHGSAHSWYYKMYACIIATKVMLERPRTNYNSSCKSTALISITSYQHSRVSGLSHSRFQTPTWFCLEVIF